MNRFLLMVLLFLCFHQIRAQYSESITSSRPGQAFVPFSVGKNVLQLQTGLNYSEKAESGSIRYGEYLDYAAAIRYGISERLEIRTAFVFRSLDREGATGNINEKGLSQVDFGARYNVLKGKDGTPALGFQAEWSVANLSEDFGSENHLVKLSALHSQKLFWTLNLTTNLSYQLNTILEESQMGYVVNLSTPLGSKWSAFVETYGNYYGEVEFAPNGFDIFFDMGCAYLVNKDLQFDLSAGLGENNRINCWFVDAGVSWRVKFIENPDEQKRVKHNFL